MQQSKLFCILPDYVCTPDGMEIAQYGNLVLSCPNFADNALSGCVVKIDKAGNVKKWFDVPVLEETGVARNMGIAFDSEYNVYLCDNQGWSERPELLYKGRVLRLKVDDEGNILDSRVVAWGMEHPNGIRIRGNYMYVTQSYLHPIHHESGKLVSGVYRFALDEENVKVNNDLSDKNLFATFVTENPDCQYGADGIVFDREGNLYVGNFGDASINRITFREDGTMTGRTQLESGREMEWSGTWSIDFYDTRRDRYLNESEFELTLARGSATEQYGLRSCRQVKADGSYQYSLVISDGARTSDMVVCE